MLQRLRFSLLPVLARRGLLVDGKAMPVNAFATNRQGATASPHTGMTSSQAMPSQGTPSQSTPSQSTPSQSSSSTASPVLTWTEFFHYRRRVRTLGSLGGIMGASVFFAGELVFLSQPIFDPTMTIYGLDPIVALGLASITGLFGSYMATSALVRAVWRLLNRDRATALDLKQRDFLSRIFKYRVNVSANQHLKTKSFKIDLYGEKIASVSDYRSWLRQQAEFRRNAEFKL